MSTGAPHAGALSCLAGARILVVEDEPFIAMDLMLAIEDAGGKAVGPATSVREALELIETQAPDAAVLDVNLPDGHVGAVIEALPRTTAIVVHTGVGLPDEIRAARPDIPVFSKPTPPIRLLGQLAAGLEARKRN
ncbi:MAG TPA: response regulator [Hyphomonadaceae bacterium]|jgi:CheY-like chemotaxis protein|nr:response regulator [Hyphomonadaceae bacterium]